MPAVTSRINVVAPGAVLASWLGACFGALLAPLLAALGQGLGAVLGGCRWIGLSLPPDRQVWALVNQPTLDFAIRPAALGYWFGSLALPLLFAALAVALLPRLQGVAWELAVVQSAWFAAVIGGAWLPLLDPEDGHLARWLFLHRWPAELASFAPTLAAVAAVPAVLRLLALLRAGHRSCGRALRLTTVLIHLGLPTAGWVAATALLRGGLPLPSAVASAAPLVIAFAVAFYGYPAPYVRPLEPVRAGSMAWLLIWTLALAAGVAVAGRPLADDEARAVLWARPDGMNNLRPWMRPVPERLDLPRSLLDDPDGT